MKRKKTKPTRSRLTKEADRLFSLYTRQKYAKENGEVKCYTCPYVAHWKKMQNGHYISRFYKYTRWDEDNCRPQCFGCNIRMSGNAFIFRGNLVDEIGERKVSKMEEFARTLFKEKDEWIETIITKYAR